MLTGARRTPDPCGVPLRYSAACTLIAASASSSRLDTLDMRISFQGGRADQCVPPGFKPCRKKRQCTCSPCLAGYESSGDRERKTMGPIQLGQRGTRAHMRAADWGDEGVLIALSF